MAKHFNVTGLLTQELLPPGNGVSVSEVSLTNVGFTSAAKIDLYMEKKLTGKFYLLREVVIPLGVTLTHEIIGFNNNIGEFGMYVRLHGSASFVLTGSIDPVASAIVTGVGTAFLREVAAGDSLLVSGETRIVNDVASNTALRVTEAFSNNSNDTSPEITPVSPVDIIFA
tara:strand:+ start:48 stop:557 length:510 start_codon:yes stop_codon:yes gene_type:complete